ncbi:MAG: hypothetical protein ABJA64_03000, partial [Candidatus Saccharibacteria bacterium]
TEMVYSGNVDYWNKQLEKDKRLSKIAYENNLLMRKSKVIHLSGASRPLTDYEPVVQFVTQSDGKRILFRIVKEIKIGDTVHRLLKTGDMVMVNRNPTIRKESYNAHRVWICPDPNVKTIGLPDADCSAYNADFDGDEMNIHVPQGVQCQAELAESLNIEKRIMTDQTSSHIIKLIQPVVYGVFLMTRDDCMIPRRTFNDLVLHASGSKSSITTLATLGSRQTEIIDWQDLLKRAKPHFFPDCKDFRKLTMIPGKVAFSLVLPKYYTRKHGCKWDKKGKLTEGAIIENGVLIQGQLDSKAMNRITEDIYVEFSHQQAIDYINGTRFICRWWNNLNGFTFGLGDCQNTRQEQIKATLEETFSKVAEIEKQPIREEEKKAKTREILEKATQIGQMIAKDGMLGGQNNAMSIATLSGAKGSFTNLSYITCFLGLQTVDGKEYTAELCDGNRVLPCFKMNERSIAARGFISENFKKGLTPVGMFFHARSARKGLVDTAVTTKDSGYIQRKLGKKMENMHVDIFGCVLDCDGSIVAFSYGEMGFDPMEIYWTGGYAFPIDFKVLVERINYEWVDAGNDDGSKTLFGEKQFEFIEKHLVLVGSETEPVKAIKRRIMWHIEQGLKGVEIIVSKWCIDEFFSRMRKMFYETRIQPGNMVGFKSTFSIGSVSTQDALNAFHSSGTSSRTTTSGLPRQNELTNLSSKPRNTGGSFKYQDDILDDETADKASKMMRVSQLRKIFEYRKFGDFVSCEVMKCRKSSVTNESEAILGTHNVFKKPKWFDLFFEVMDQEVPDGIHEDGFIIKCTVDVQTSFKYKISLDQLAEIIQHEGMMVIVSPLDENTLYILSDYENVELTKDVDGDQPSWKYYWTRDHFLPEILDTKVCGIEGISEIFYSHENIIDYQGHNFGELMQTENVVFSSLKTDYVWEVVEFLGIDAAYIFLYEELSN